MDLGRKFDIISTGKLARSGSLVTWLKSRLELVKSWWPASQEAHGNLPLLLRQAVVILHAQAVGFATLIRAMQPDKGALGTHGRLEMLLLHLGCVVEMWWPISSWRAISVSVEPWLTTSKKPCVTMHVARICAQSSARDSGPSS